MIDYYDRLLAAQQQAPQDSRWLFEPSVPASWSPSQSMGSIPPPQAQQSPMYSPKPVPRSPGYTPTSIPTPSYTGQSVPSPAPTPSTPATQSSAIDYTGAFAQPIYGSGGIRGMGGNQPIGYQMMRQIGGDGPVRNGTNQIQNIPVGDPVLGSFSFGNNQSGSFTK